MRSCTRSLACNARLTLSGEFDCRPAPGQEQIADSARLMLTFSVKSVKMTECLGDDQLVRG